MEEKEALKRQIELLQNLINNHKSVHGDGPSSAGQWLPERQPERHPGKPTPARGRAQRSSSYTPRGGPHNSLPAGQWRKTYSLSNKTSLQRATHTTQSSVSSASSSSASLASSQSNSQSSHCNKKDPANGESVYIKDATLISEGLAGGPGAQKSVLTEGVRRAATGGGSTAASSEVGPCGGGAGVEPGAGIRVSGLTETAVPPADAQKRIKQGFQPRDEGKSAGLLLKTTTHGGREARPSLAKASATARLQSSTQLLIRPRLPGKASSGDQQTTAKTTTSSSTLGNITPPLPSPLSASLNVLQRPPLSSTPKPTSAEPQISSSPLRRSKFTWVKTQEAGGSGPNDARAEPPPPGKLTSSSSDPNSHPEVSGGASPSLSVIKKPPSKKVPRRHSLSTAASKTSRYTWVSSSARAQDRPSRKPLSPKALAPPQRAPERGEAARKARSALPLPGTQRKGTGASSSSSSSSRYCWKAGGQQQGSGTGAAAPRGSAFHWTSGRERAHKGLKASSVTPSVLGSSPSPGGFKLRSRMKIIRRSASSGSGLERRSSPVSVTVSSRYSLRRRTHTPVRTHTPGRSPGGAGKRTPTRELVAFGRHKLRRLSPNSSRTGSSPASTRSPASQRVLRTRYKIVTRQGSAHNPHYSPAPSWRARRIQSARSLLQSRLRPPQDRHPDAPYWRGRDMRWIGGSLYRVSANKLSRTAAAGVSISRTGRWSRWPGPQDTPPPAPPGRASSTRHVASRAVQRSLAIIRHQARQKKPQKQYCMYYNRFGKCNRGDACPYIHDPDKVAVCTRFLRGTCKQTDGTCPFSHKVAKEKMPVCSFFLRGICNNSSCPYSHVYVSRKAAVCQDFIRGYCPQGEKCKKKHTLVCPDFSGAGSCPRGSSCKLQHRQRAKRTAPLNAVSATKRARAKDAPNRPRLSVLIPPGPSEDPQAELRTPSSDPHRLPSFISLSSSPEEADAPDTPPGQGPDGTERKLQIKPRL